MLSQKSIMFKAIRLRYSTSVYYMQQGFNDAFAGVTQNKN